MLWGAKVRLESAGVLPSALCQPSPLARPYVPPPQGSVSPVETEALESRATPESASGPPRAFAVKLQLLRAVIQ